MNRANLTDDQLDTQIVNVRRQIALGKDHAALLAELVAERNRRGVAKGRRPSWSDIINPAEGEILTIGGKPAVVRWDGHVARLLYEGKTTTLTELDATGHKGEVWLNAEGQSLFGPGGLYDERCVAMGFPSSFEPRG